uniref:Large ribosomal subunit protein bL35m n=1 Tax=Ceriodaphnia reticulata TaxID=302197 RepID=A0A4Y7LZP9_9CRUS|nr:EOG090X0J5E [Ceriodaphnia reticulata]SVE73312.1 EOG090X0J5E [Ceriodaphnia reticulata]
MFSFRNLVLSSLRLSNVAKNYNSVNRIGNVFPAVLNFSSTSTSQSLFRGVQHCSPLINTNTSILSSVSTVLNNLAFKASPSLQPIRSVTKWSLKKGKRKTVKAVVDRFYRLAWGAWIRPMVGRKKHHWRKTAKRKIRAQKHVFCNATQSTLLDKMVTKYWRKRRFYVDDIYEPYHQREEYYASAVKPH